MNKLFDSYANYYDLLYRDKDYTAETNYIVRTLHENDIRQGDILEFGSGTGGHAKLMVKHGYKVHGVELSHEMVKRIQVVPGFTCEQGDVTNIKINKKFDALVSIFHVVSYQVSQEKVNNIFSNAYKHLKKGGVFIFDVWYSPAVFSQKPEVRLKKISDKYVEVDRIAEPVIYPNENRVDVKYTIYSRDLISQKIDIFTEIHPMRHFSMPEIAWIARSNGFELVSSEEFLTRAVPSEKTWGVCFVIKKV